MAKQNKGFFSRAFDFIKAEVTGRPTMGYHEDEIMAALLKAGKKYYKDPVLAYEEHIWTYASIWAISNAAAMLGRKMQDYDNEGKRIDVDQHWLLDLLEFPNKEYSGYDLIEGTFVYLELLGDSYWEVVRDNTGRPTAFYLMRSDRVTPVGDEKQLVRGYKYMPNVREYFLAPEEVIHFKYFSPRSEINGQGSIKAATQSLESDYLGSESSKDFFRRGAIPSFIVENPTRMSEPAYKRLRKALKRHQGVGKQRDVLILEEGSKYVKTEMTPKESGGSETSGKAKEAVSAGVGVPPMKIQSMEGASYANARFQDLSFWRNTMEPRMKKFYARITLDCLRNMNETASITPDMLKMLMNIDEFKNEATAYADLVERGILKRNEARHKLDLDSVGEEGEVLTVNPNLVPLKDVVGSLEQEELDESEG